MKLFLFDSLKLFSLIHSDESLMLWIGWGFFHTEIVMGYFIRQKTKHTGWCGYYLQSIVGNKICKCLVSFVNDEAALILHAAWEQLCAAGKDNSYPFITKKKSGNKYMALG